MKKLTLSDFALMDVIRDDEKAELIFGYHEGKPVRLIGFSAPPWKSNFETQEDGYYFFRSLLDRCGKPGANLY